MPEKEKVKTLSSRADRNMNPTAFTCDLARQAGLQYGTDFVTGDPFGSLPTLYTARLLRDPVALTLDLIDRVGFYTNTGASRWIYIGIPKFVWDILSTNYKKDIIKWMYHREGGTALEHLFV